MIWVPGSSTRTALIVVRANVIRRRPVKPSSRFGTNRNLRSVTVTWPAICNLRFAARACQYADAPVELAFGQTGQLTVEVLNKQPASAVRDQGGTGAVVHILARHVRR